MVTQSKYRWLKTLVILVLSGMILQFSGCRKTITPTEEELAAYGWVLYDEGNWLESNHWFGESIIEDSSYQDGYNGLGWTFGKLQEPDSSVKYFEQGLGWTQDPNLETNVRRELWAGLCFILTADGRDSSSVIYGDSLLTDIANDIPSRWTFSHDTTLNHLDLRLSMAISRYALSEFSTSLLHVQAILEAISPSTTTFVPDINTVAGRRELADQMETLRNILN